MPKLANHEDAEQAALFDWAAYQPELRWLHAIPNGGNRNRFEAARLKRQGVKPGVADVFLPLPRGQYCGLYIELKRRRIHGRSVVRPDQVEFLQAMESAGYFAIVCYGADEAVAQLQSYLELGPHLSIKSGF